MPEKNECPFADLCEDCHPEKDMVEKRKTCTEKSSRQCGVYWAFLEGYLALDEKES